jgi:hypothetical protein
MEALGQTDTLGYKKLKNQQLIAEREFSKRIQSLAERAERLKAPLKTKPVGRNVKPKDVYTLTKDGKEVGKFKNEDEAYASMFLTPETEGGLSDAELEDIAVKGGNLGVFRNIRLAASAEIIKKVALILRWLKIVLSRLL